MTTTQVLLLFLVGSPFFSNASPHGNVGETILQVKKDEPLTCPEGFIIDGTLTRCLRVATGYEDACVESKQCSELLSAGAICKDGQCLCLDGYHYLHGKCHKSKGLFESCENDVDCFVHAEYHAVACIQKVCQCRDGFYQREYSTCRRKAKEINDECLINSDCAFDEKTICVNQTCTLSGEPTREEKKYHTYNRHRFKLNVTTKDASNIENHRTWTDTSVYNFEREKLTLTEPISTTTPPILVGNDCKEDKDCGSLLNSYCGADKKCTCRQAHFASDDSTACIPEIGEKCTDQDELHVEYAVCKDDQWTCAINRIAEKNNRLCNIVRRYDDKCKSNDQCQLLGPRAECESKSCQCDSTSHWLQDETFCWVTKKVEEECESDSDCNAVGNSITPVCLKKGEKKLCSCPVKSHIGKSDGNKVCIMDQTELGSYCAEDSDCKLAHSACRNNKCECEMNYFESDKSCLAGLNANCEKNTECKQSNTVCLQGKNGATCQCADDFIVTPESNCIHKSLFNETCKCNLQCSSATANALCLTNGTSLPEENCDTSHVGLCGCIEEDYYRDGACFKKKKLGEECSKRGECFTKSGGEHAVCRNGICSCDFDYKNVDDNCVPVSYANSIAVSLWTVLLFVMLI